jgi:hypothetical protein
MNTINFNLEISMSHCRIAILSAAMLVAIAGCNNQKTTTAESEDPAYCKAYKGETDTVNKMCAVVTDDPVNPKVEPVIWKGQKVGFCCDGCKPTWAKMTEAEKDAAVAKAIAMTPPKAE